MCVCALSMINHIHLSVSQSIVVDEGGMISSGENGCGIGKMGQWKGPVSQDRLWLEIQMCS